MSGRRDIVIAQTLIDQARRFSEQYPDISKLRVGALRLVGTAEFTEAVKARDGALRTFAGLARLLELKRTIDTSPVLLGLARDLPSIAAYTARMQAVMTVPRITVALESPGAVETAAEIPLTTVVDADAALGTVWQERESIPDGWAAIPVVYATLPASKRWSLYVNLAILVWATYVYLGALIDRDDLRTIGGDLIAALGALGLLYVGTLDAFEAAETGLSGEDEPPTGA